MIANQSITILIVVISMSNWNKANAQNQIIETNCKAKLQFY